MLEPVVLGRALARGVGVACALAVMLSLGMGSPSQLLDGRGTVVLLVLVALLIALVTAGTEALERRRWSGLELGAAVTGALGVGLCLAYVQACYASGMLAGGALGDAIDRAERSALSLLGPASLGMLAAAAPYGAWAALRARGTARTMGAIALALVVAVGGIALSFVVLTNRQGSFAPPLLALAGLVIAPLVDLLVDPRGLPRMSDVAWTRTVRAFGLLLPLICFAVNESMGTVQRHPLSPKWQRPGLGVWWELALISDAHRPLYPLMAWAWLALLLAPRATRPRAWLRVGLSAGVGVSALFCALYLPALIFSAFLSLVGIGLLGFAPYLSLAVYVSALRRYREAWVTAEHATGEGNPTAPAEPVPTSTADDARAHDGAALLGAGAALLGSAGLLGASNELARMYALLPATEPPSCYLATVASRGAPADVPRERVVLPSGAVRDVTPQLRTFKAGELLLAASAPRLHRALRRGYDRVGPPLAARVGRRQARALYLLLRAPAALIALALRARLGREVAGALEAAMYRERPNE